MTASILVAYATRYGSTQEVAEAVGATLREQGLEVEVRPAREVRDLDGYGAVVIGAALYFGAWHGDAQKFLARHHDALSKLPVAVFALGPLGSSEEEMREPRAELAQSLAKEPWFKPVSSTVFAGMFDPARLRFPFSLVKVLPASPLKNSLAKDARDWAAIRAWAEGLVAALGVQPRLDEMVG